MLRVLICGLQFELHVKSEFTTKCKYIKLSYIHSFCLACNKKKPGGVKWGVFFKKGPSGGIITEMWLQISLKESEDKEPFDKSLNQ